MKLSIRALLLVLPLLMLTVNSCKKDDDGPATYSLQVYLNQTGNSNANALIAHIENNSDHSVLNFYGTFNIDDTPASLKTITYQKANNDTTVFYIMNDTTGRLETSYISVAGVKDPWVCKYEYIPNNNHAFIFSIYQYDWNTNTGTLKYQATLENNSGTVTHTPTYANFKTQSGFFDFLTDVPLAVGIVETVILATGGEGIVVAVAGTAVAGACGGILAGAAGLLALNLALDYILGNDANAAVPDDVPYPPNTPEQNPTLNNNPNPNLPPNPNTAIINFDANMSQQGDILVFGVSGGTAPYSYCLGFPLNFQQSTVFEGSHAVGDYWITVKDANGVCKSKYIHLDPTSNITIYDIDALLGVTTNTINDIEFDSNGNVWMATNGEGLIKFDGTNFTSYTTTNSNAPTYHWRDIEIGNDNKIYLLPYGDTQYIHCFNGSTFSGGVGFFVDPDLGMTSGNCNFFEAMYLDKATNTIWVGENYWGLSKVDLSTNTPTRYGYLFYTPQCPVGDIHSISKDNAGNIIYGTSVQNNNSFTNMLISFNGNNWNTDTYSTTTFNRAFKTIKRCQDGTNWANTTDEIVKINGGSFTSYNSSNSPINTIITTFNVDPSNNHLWVSVGASLYEFDGTNWTTHSLSDEWNITDNYVYSINFDSFGNKWFGMNGKLLKVKP
jgi:hypothetical protein